MKAIEFVRALRTPGSERFLLQTEGRDAGAVDLHFLPAGGVAGTVVLLDDGPVTDDEVPALLTRIDEQLLPDATLDRNVFFTVVRGRVVGSFQPEG